MNIEINCCLLALAFAIINIFQLFFFFRYLLTLEKEIARLNSDKNKDHIEFQKKMAQFKSDKNKDRIEFHKKMAHIASETKVIIKKIIVL